MGCGCARAKATIHETNVPQNEPKKQEDENKTMPTIEIKKVEETKSKKERFKEIWDKKETNGDCMSEPESPHKLAPGSKLVPDNKYLPGHSHTPGPTHVVGPGLAEEKNENLENEEKKEEEEEEEEERQEEEGEKKEEDEEKKEEEGEEDKKEEKKVEVKKALDESEESEPSLHTKQYDYIGDDPLKKAQKIFKYQNLARTNPELIVKKLKKLQSQQKGKPLFSEESIKDAIHDLSMRNPVRALEWDEGMYKACQDHIIDLGEKGTVSHVGTDGSTVFERINRYGRHTGFCGENIQLSKEIPKEIVLSMVVDSANISKEHRRTLMQEKFTLGAVTIGTHIKHGVWTVFAYSAN